MDFEANVAVRDCRATTLYSWEDVCVDKGEQLVISVRSAKGPDDCGLRAWGSVRNCPLSRMGCKGVLRRRTDSDKIILLNVSDGPIRIPRGARVANFDDDDPDYYIGLSWDWGRGSRRGLLLPRSSEPMPTTDRQIDKEESKGSPSGGRGTEDSALEVGVSEEKKDDPGEESGKRRRNS